MPKINFNVPFVNEKGEPMERAKFDNKKQKLGNGGRIEAQPIVDAEGYVVTEVVTMKDMLSTTIGTFYPGDEKLDFSERAKRAKLLRKIQTKSTANYTVEELKIIQDLTALAGSVAFIMQLDELINGVPDGEQDNEPAAEAGEKTA